MKISIVVFGKTAKNFVQEGEDFFVSRLSPFVQLEMVTLVEEKIAKTISEKQVKEKESDRFFERFPEEKIGFLMACDVRGKAYSSEEFAEKIEKIRDGYGKLTIVIGGTLGLSEKILNRANAKISFSSMTFPHDFFRLLLLEQVYRSMMILSGREYHR